jgi:hypothetical protein
LFLLPAASSCYHTSGANGLKQRPEGFCDTHKSDESAKTFFIMKGKKKKKNYIFVLSFISFMVMLAFLLSRRTTGPRAPGLMKKT